MYLESIKLSGFKSFVEPTTVSLPSRMNVIVGPNGCGKSNLVDAIRWVIGESSGRTLRAELLSDVIFEGTQTRSPAGRASVTLLFDNSDGRIGGEFANYGQVELRREVAADEQSAYYLNGHRCRRRDVRDLFLGTGFGTRGYAVIEQGLVGQLVQSKPEDLRQHIEEAAGVSKYRERRRETEIKLERTRRNLERVDDQLIELKRQINMLSRQARAAERHRQYTDERRLHVAMRLNVQIRTQRAQLDELQRQDQELKQNRLELDTVRQRIETELVRLETTASEQIESRARAQNNLYEVNSEITRVEQEISSRNSRVQEYDSELSATATRIDALETELDAGRLAIASASRELDEYATQEIELRLKVSEARRELHSARAAQQRNQGQYQMLSEEFNALAAERERLMATNSGATQRTRDLRDQLARLSSRNADFAQTKEHLQATEQRLNQAQQKREQARTSLANVDERIADLTDKELAEREQLSRYQVRFGELNSEKAALQLVLSKAEANDRDVEHWNVRRVRQGLDPNDRLYEKLSIEETWESALETVLGADVHAFAVDDIAALYGELLEEATSSLTFVETGAVEPATFALPPLASFLREGKEYASHWLYGVFACDSLAEGLQYHRQLAPYQSIVTRDGDWLGPTWVRMRRDRTDATDKGIFAQTRRLEALNNELALTQATLSATSTSHASLERQLGEETLQRLEVLQNVDEAVQAVSAIETEHAVAQDRLVIETRQSDDLLTEVAAIKSRIETEQQLVADSQKSFDDATRRFQAKQSERVEAARANDDVTAEVGARESTLESELETLHEFLLELQHSTNQSENLRQTRQRQQGDLELAVMERQRLNRSSAQMRRDLPALQDRQEVALRERVMLDSRIEQWQQRIDSTQEERRQALDAQRANSARLNTQQERINELSGRLATNQSEISHLEQELLDTGVDEQRVCDHIGESTTLEQIDAKLEVIDRRIARLGEINQTAIREHEERSKERTLLEEQVDDLNEALESLAAAIRRIDTETRDRVSATFRAVNEHLSEIFPLLFGGGVATLELSTSNLLEAGFSLRATPPGKRNLPVSLLSGGEKALAALAFVFAMFKLNPSPVCILDEVDAPLDEANLGRFTQLLSSMQEETQFVVITHNPVTMECAETLIGVTMEEAGVSRVVSVDLNDALAAVAPA